MKLSFKSLERILRQHGQLSVTAAACFGLLLVNIDLPGMEEKQVASVSGYQQTSADVLESIVSRLEKLPNLNADQAQSEATGAGKEILVKGVGL